MVFNFNQIDFTGSLKDEHHEVFDHVDENDQDK